MIGEPMDRHGNDTLLHIATSAKCTTFVNQLLQLLSREDMETTNRAGDTALCIAASSGALTIAEAMVLSNNNLPMIRGRANQTPLRIAALFGHKPMVRYLYSVTDFDSLSPQERFDIFLALIRMNVYDIGLQLLERYPELATASDNLDCDCSCDALTALAKKHPDDYYAAAGTGSTIGTIFGSFINSYFNFSGIYREPTTMPESAHQLSIKIWERVLQLPDDKIWELINKPFFEAARSGNAELLALLIGSYPALIRRTNKERLTIFHIAVLHRQEKVFNLIYNIGALKDLIVTFRGPYDSGNTMLHLAGLLPVPPQNRFVSWRPNLQIKRELLWFREVEKIVPPEYISLKNGNELTPKNIFDLEHRELFKIGETAMKEVAYSCMLVSTLIATVVFAAALTVPGTTTTTTTTTAMLDKEEWFKIYIVSNAVALFAASSSIILLLSILTSSFTENEYMTSLQTRLMLGVTTLFVSITSMVLAFTAASFLLFDHRTAWVSYLIASLACGPVLLFVALHYSLWLDLIRSAYWSTYLFRPTKFKLFLSVASNLQRFYVFPDILIELVCGVMDD